ncbi:MAG: MepB family protein [Bacteroidales bacterium]|nr:MepB family protein [Bacteroidales bacterium]
MMDDNLKEVLSKIYDLCGFTISNFFVEEESREYDASRFQLNGFRIVCRSARTTPKKVGQFVTFWKRSGNGPIEPLNANDPIDCFMVLVRLDKRLGHFVFPKSVLMEKGILSTDYKEGKRAFRVYPGWDQAQNKQAVNSQKWQLNYFLEVEDNTDLEKVKRVFSLM